MELSILCVSDLKERAKPFLREMQQLSKMIGAEFALVVDGVHVRSKGYIESVLDEALTFTHGDYILRLDDDEKCSPAMIRWLIEREYKADSHWSFPRVHLWDTPKQMIFEPYYWPDLQTRLSVREKAGGRPKIHSGSPFGAGTIARVCIEHWVYLCKSKEERLQIARRYHAIQPGSDGGEFRASSVEDEHPNGCKFMEYTDGSVPWQGRVFSGPLL